MADEAVSASEKSSLSAFDKLKLSTTNNNSYSTNRNTKVTRHSIDKNSQSVSQGVTSTASVSGASCQTSSSGSKKSIDSKFSQFECSNNNKNKSVMFGGTNEKNTSVYGKTRASGCLLFPPPIVPKKNEKTMQISCDATDNNNDSVIPSSPLTSSSSNSLPLNEMVLPNNGAGSFGMFSSSSSSSTQMVQDKVNNQFDSNEVSNKMLKSGKCKNSVSVSSSSSSSSPTIVAASANSSSPIPIKPKCSSNICAPPPKVPPYNNKVGNGSNKRSNAKAKNSGLPLLPGKLTKAAAKHSASNMDNNKLTETTDGRNKKKRCSDRYDSSESSDSGVATSLSCTDSSTASSDVSDPDSPYSPVLLGDDLHHKNSISMPPQTILATTNGNAGKSPTTSAASPLQNGLKGSKQQHKQSQNKNQQQPKHTKSSQLTTSSPLQKHSQHIWPWTTLGGVGAGGNFSSEMASSPKTNSVALNNTTKNTNKRHSQTSSTPSDGGAKKTRTTNSSSKDNNTSIGGGVNVNGIALQPPQAASNNKRLKAAALEESQTKITGYFKSQMKAQIHQSGLKKETLPHILPSSSSSSSSLMSTLSPSVTVTAVVSSASSMSPNSNVPPVKTTSSSLNKYFNLMREEQERTASTASSTNASNLPSLPPALKKIERSKPTKIAQVAPNLRKTTAAPPLSHITEKSPKKHVAIAPRTADTRQRHEPLSVPSPLKAPNTPPQQQQPAVLLTAIHIPQSNQPPQLVPTSPRQQVTVGKTQQTNVSPTSKIPTGPSLYQIPMMPNLVQFPNLIAANVSQCQLTGASGNHHHHQAATAQYFLNGTVFKLQQFTPPSPTSASAPAFSMDNGNQSINTTTVPNNTAIAIEQHHASNNKNTSSITATSLQEMLSNQFQTQQQQQQQQQQSVSAHNHRLHHSQPVFMATTTGLLLNATSLPAMLASSGKQTMAIQPQQIPALQPIQGASTIMPGLSSIFSPLQEQQLQQYKSEQVVANLESQIPSLQQTNIPPLSVSSSAFSKLAIVKAGNSAFTPSVHQVSATQPPPLVTISSGSPIVSDGDSKPLVSAKPYQQKSGQQENIVTKSKRGVSDNTKKSWQDAVQPILLAPMPPKSPPALIYPSLIASKEEQHKTEDIFDLLKNSKNETTLSPPFSMQYQSTEEKSLEQEQEPEPEPEPEEEEEGSTSRHTLSMESSSLLSPETTSNTIISEESIKVSSPLEYSLASSSLISSESPKLEIEIDEKPDKTQTPVVTVTETSSSDTASVTLSPTVDIALADNDTLPKCAISPILSQPKTIRFPAKHESGHRFGPKGMRRHDGVCYWDKCNKKHESNSKLLDHMQTHHVNTQTGPFACLWLGCKVYGRESCSRRWLERHVLSHGGTKPFKCIVDGCGLRFGSQLALQKHVNGHFTATESKDSTSKRTSDPPVPKLLRKNGKKLRYRRQPFSARMFDFFDTGIMEGLHHRLRQISTLTNGKNCVTFRGEVTMRRKNLNGIVECFVQWSPPEIISNEWLPESIEPYIKTLPIGLMQPKEKTNVELLLRSAYRLPHSPNLFQSFHSLSRQNSNDSSSTNMYPDHSQSSTPTSEYPTDETSRSSSFGNSSLGSISNLPLKFPQIELRQKQSRKQPKRIQPS